MTGNVQSPLPISANVLRCVEELPALLNTIERSVLSVGKSKSLVVSLNIPNFVFRYTRQAMTLISIISGIPTAERYTTGMDLMVIKVTDKKARPTVLLLKSYI